MKRIVSLLLAFVLVLTAGCGGMKEQGEIPAAPEKRAEEIPPAAVEQTVLEAAQVEPHPLSMTMLIVPGVIIALCLMKKHLKA